MSGYDRLMAAQRAGEQYVQDTNRQRLSDYNNQKTQGGYNSVGGPPNLESANKGTESFGDWLKTSMRGEPYAYQADKQGFQYGGQFGGADAATRRYQGIGAEAGARGAYQMDPSQANQARGFQSAAAVDYLRTLNGQNPSIAQRQMQLGLGQAQGNALGMAAGARGGGANQAAAMRSALASNNQMSSQVSQQAGIEALREREAARQGLASVGGQMRGQDIGWQQGQGALEMQQRGLNDATRLGYERLGADVQGQQLQANQNYERLGQESNLAQRGQNYNVQKFNKEQSMSGIGSIGTALGAIFSDERLKKSVSGAELGSYAGDLAGDGDPEYGDNATFALADDMKRSGDMGRQSWGRMQRPPEDLYPAYDAMPEVRGGAVTGRTLGQSFDAAAGVKAQSAAADRKSDQRNQKFQESFERSMRSTAGESKSNRDLQKGAADLGKGIGKLLSDKKKKKAAKPAKDSELQKFARGMDAKTFRYKDESDKAPKRLGVMAQDVEKSKEGKKMVMETGMGKAIDIPKAVSAALATIAEMREELDELQGKKKKARKEA